MYSCVVAKGVTSFIDNRKGVNNLTRHADASESTPFVNAGSLVLAWVRLALVDVDLAPATPKPGWAIAFVRPGCVDTNTSMFTGRT